MMKNCPDSYIGLSLILSMLYRALHQAPSDDFIRALYGNDVIEDWPLEVNNPALQQGLSLLASPADISLIQFDFAALFVGPNALRAAPWASVYLNEEQATFGAQTLAIRKVYNQFGLELQTGQHEPDDHIGIIFGFISYLCELIAEQQVNGQPTEESTLAVFLTEHVLTWAPRMLDTMRAAAESPFYQGIALVAQGTLRQLADLVNAQYQSVPLYR
ncbi:TorD/DmsD family molecular chaperone [Vibrio sp. WXL210]|uniref:TorD/DmsD family molecular chaperone n=1 Tax=Vibrio sp. WXL210 TaxID=3450709 RepID=UPI003EC7B879